MRLALFEPDIPQNAAALIRLASCVEIGIDIIEPCGFLFSDKGFRRAGMDYLETAELVRHDSWSAFLTQAKSRRIVLLTSKGTTSFLDFAFKKTDILLLGRESAGAPAYVHETADARLRIPMKRGARSINVAQAGAMVLGEALRQTKDFPQ